MPTYSLPCPHDHVLRFLHLLSLLVQGGPHPNCPEGLEQKLEEGVNDTTRHLLPLEIGSMYPQFHSL